MYNKFGLNNFEVDFDVKSNTYHLSKYLGEHKTLYVPNDIYGVPIVSILEGAFSSCENLSVIILSKNIKNIHNNAFRKTNNLVLYTPRESSDLNFVPDNANVVVRFGFEQIVHDDKILYALFKDKTAIAFDNDILSMRKERLGRFGFKTRIEDYIYEEYKVIGIENCCFRDVYNLKGIQFPKTLKWIGIQAFQNCEILESVEFNEELERVHDLAFSKCLDLKLIKINNQLNYIGKHTFMDTYKTTICIQPMTNTDLWEKDWNPEKLTVINDYIAEVTIKGIKYILTGHFQAIIIGSELTNITEVYIPEYVSFNNENYEVVSIGKFAFYKDKYIKSINIPKTVKTIYNNAFSESNLKSVSLPESLDYLGEAVFSYCIFLEQIRLPQNLTEVPISLLQGCISLSKVALSLNIKTLKQSCFQGCKNLTHFEMPISVKTIEAYSLCDVKIPSIQLGFNINYIGDYAFAENEVLSSLIILNKDCICGNHIITYYDNTTIYIEGPENSVAENTIRFNATKKPIIYNDCVKIIEVEGIIYLLNAYDMAIVIGYNEELIEEKSIILDWIYNTKVSWIEKRAFYGSHKLKDLYIPSSVGKIGDYIVEGCINLHTMRISGKSDIIKKIQKQSNKNIIFR